MASDPSSGPFQCPGCGKTYALKSQLWGRTVQCKCGQMMIAPRAPVDPPAGRPKRSSRGVSQPSLAEILEEEGDEALPMASPSHRSSRDKAGRRERREASGRGDEDGDGWKWWYYIIAGALIGAFSVWQLVDEGSILRFGGRRGGPVGGLLLAALCIAVGLFSRPSREE